jgi:hypothetical protein
MGTLSKFCPNLYTREGIPVFIVFGRLGQREQMRLWQPLSVSVGPAVVHIYCLLRSNLKLISILFKVSFLISQSTLVLPLQRSVE